MEHYWSRLDNAGKIYPAIISLRNTTLFRIELELKDPVNPLLLQKALDEVITRYPYFNVFLRKGLYWYYFKKTDCGPLVSKDLHYPCTAYRFKRKHHFFSVKYSAKKVSVEFSHALTDGSGGLDFIKSLLYRYMNLCGTVIGNACGIKVPGEDVDPEEYSDAFKKFHDVHIPPRGSRNLRAYHIRTALLPRGVYRVTSGKAVFGDMKKAAKERGLSITGFVCFVYMKLLQEMMYEEKKRLYPISINVPVNLHNMFPSQSMFNFFISVTPSIDPRIGFFSDEDIIKHIQTYMKMEVDARYIGRMIRRNIAAERNILLRTMFLFFKEMILPSIFRAFGERGYSSGVSNMGKIDFPREMEEKIESIRVIPPPSPGNLIKMTCLSYKDNFIMTFGSIAGSREVERHFFTSLRKMGIPVKVEANL